jgi:hypothetical protein
LVAETVVSKHLEEAWTRDRCEAVAREVEDEIARLGLRKVIQEDRAQLVSHLRAILGLR